MTLKQTTKAEREPTYILDESREQIDVAKPISQRLGGDIKAVMDDLIDLVAATKEKYEVVIVDSWDELASATLRQCTIETATDKMRNKKSFGSGILGGKPQYGQTQWLIAKQMIDLMEVAPNSIHISHPYTVTRGVPVTNEQGQTEIAQVPDWIGFKTEGAALTKAAMQKFSPTMAWVGTETKGVGKGAKTEHIVRINEFKDDNGTRVECKWQGLGDPEMDAIKYGPISIEGLEASQELWRKIKHGRPKICPAFVGYSAKGKTSLALALWPDFWGDKNSGKVLYVACDPSSESLPTYWPGTVR